MALESDYFIIAFYQYANAYLFEEGRAFTPDEFERFVASRYFDNTGMDFKRSAIHLHEALGRLTQGGVVVHLPDAFAGDFYDLDVDRNALAQYLTSGIGPSLAFFRVGASADNWLGAALRQIEALAEEETADAEAVSDEKPDDDWEPLPLSATAPESQEAILQLEAAIRDLAADNGFSVTYPSQRDSILAQASATLESVKAGTATKGQVRHNLVAAGRWVAEKFTGSAIGAIGAELVKWALRLLGVPV